MFGRATITLGIGPHSSFVSGSLVILLTKTALKPIGMLSQLDCAQPGLKSREFNSNTADKRSGSKYQQCTRNTDMQSL